MKLIKTTIYSCNLIHYYGKINQSHAVYYKTGEFMNELITKTETLKSQINKIYNQQSYTNMTSVISELAQTKRIINNRIANSLPHINKTITGLCMPAAHVTNMSKMISAFSQSIASSKLALNTSLVSSVSQVIKSMKPLHVDFMKTNRKFFDRMLFMRIADQIGFPVYMEIDTELQDRLLESYRMNSNQCNKEEMSQIIVDYYNDDYVDQVLNGIRNVGIFNQKRVELISESVEVYQMGFYGTSATAFADYISGMIRDIYNEVCTMHKFTGKEKNEILACFNQNCKPDSEKGMLLQIVYSQDRSPLFWYKVVSYFLSRFYASGENGMDMYPKRHMLCHGIQLNHDTKEMNLILIMCMDIISELAWRVKKMKEENVQIVIDL